MSLTPYTKDELTAILFPPQQPEVLTKRLSALDGMLEQMRLALALVARLRGPNGCPWDREQNHLTIRPYLIEEAYETLEVLDRYNSHKDPKALARATPADQEVPADGAFSPADQEHLKEELGDLLLQVILHAQLCWERGEFHIGDIAQTMTNKLVTRHPHVFADTKITNSEGVLTNWELIKKKEKEAKSAVASNGSANATATPSAPHSALDVPRGLPSLQRAERIGDKAGRLGFDWKRKEDVFKKVEEEFHELRVALETGNTKEIEHEIGDLFYATANLARWHKIHPEDAHRKALSRFEERFKLVEAWFHKEKVDMAVASEAQLDAAWNAAKAARKAAE